jgi:hypothetical protein
MNPAFGRRSWSRHGGAGAAALLLGALLAGCDREADSTGVAFSVTPPSATIKVTETQQFTAVSAPGRVFWDTSDPAIATVVPETGFARAVGRGTATISAIANGRVAEASLTAQVDPFIQLGAATVEFAITLGEGDPPAQSISVQNGGDFTLSGLAVGGVTYGPNEPEDWLQATLAGSTAPTSLTLQASVAGLGRGVYTAVVPITSSTGTNSPQNVIVTLRVQAPPSIEVDPEQVEFAGIPDEILVETVDVTNGGDLPLEGLSAQISYTGGPSQGWMTAGLSQTEAPATLELTANTTGLAVSTYTATVTVTADGGVAPKVVPVELVVSPGPSIVVSPTTVTFNATVNASPPGPQSARIRNGGGGTLTGLSVGNVNYSGGASGWLTASLSGTTAPADLNLAVSSSSLAVGNYTATVQLLSPVASNSPTTVTVRLNVGLPPEMSLSPTSVAFSSWANATIQPGAQGVSVTNTGGGTLSGLTVTGIVYGGGSSGWLSATWQGGNTTANTVLLLQPSAASLARGTYTATVTIDAPSVSPQNVSVTFAVSGFSVDIHSAILPGCAGGSCHSAVPPGLPAGSAAQAHSNLVPTYAPTNGDDSNNALLVCKLSGGCSHAGGTWSSAVQVIRAWIRAGAPLG